MTLPSRAWRKMAMKRLDLSYSASLLQRHSRYLTGTAPECQATRFGPLSADCFCQGQCLGYHDNRYKMTTTVSTLLKSPPLMSSHKTGEIHLVAAKASHGSMQMPAYSVHGYSSIPTDLTINFSKLSVPTGVTRTDDDSMISCDKRSDAISPEAADVGDHSLEDVSKHQSPSSTDEDNLDPVSHHSSSSSVIEGRGRSQGNASPEEDTSAVSHQPNPAAESGASSDTEGAESTKNLEYGDDEPSIADSAEKKDFDKRFIGKAAYSVPPPNPFTSAFTAEEARLRYSLQNSEFKERFSHLNSSLDEEDPRQQYLYPDTPTSFKGGYPVGSPGSPDSKSLTASPNHSFQTPGSHYSPEDSDSAFSPNIRGGIYFCHLCSFSGGSQQEFDEHMTCHFEHICPHCDYKSRTEGRLKRHIKDFHTEDPDGGFGARTMPGRPKVFRCKQCEFSATNKVEFWSHSRSHIKEDKLLQCPRCPFVTEYKHHLEYHLRNHFGSKPFKCPKCNYACVNKSMLNSHMKSHTNVYQYRCADCTYATKYCHSLKLHLRKYNHKPAAVLNSDGSLPQGVDATASGLSLLAKRGPPRGPRGPRKDKVSESMMGGFMSMPPSPMARMPGVPGVPPGMMSPFWPLLQSPMPNGMPHPMQGMNHRPFPHQMMPLPGMREPGPTNGEMGSTKHLKCNLCSFAAPSKDILMSHMVKVHASENQDLFSIFGISSEALLEENHKRFDLMKSPVRRFSHNRGYSQSLFGQDNKMPASGEPLKIKTEQKEDKNKVSPNSWLDMASNRTSDGQKQGNSELNYPMNGLNRTESSGKDEGMDILKQMTLKFGPGASASAQPSQSSSLKRGRVESPLDLTKPRGSTPPFYAQHMASMQQHGQSIDDGEHSSGENSIYSMEVVSPSPRKRSRKGRAFKLDTLCLKLQERQGGESYASDEDSPSENAECSYNRQMRELESMTRSPEACKDDDIPASYRDQDKHTGNLDNGKLENGDDEGQEDEDQIQTKKRQTNGEEVERQTTPDFKQVHSNLKFLNNEMPEKDKASAHSDKSERFKDDKVEVPISQSLPAYQGDELSAEKIEKCMEADILQAKMNRRKQGHGGHVPRSSDIAMRFLNNPFITDAAHYKNGQEKQLQGPGMWVDTPDFTSTPKKQSLIDPNYECPHCQIAFGDCIMYTMHMGYHGYKDPYKCNMCGSMCKDKVEFFLHIARAAHN